ncbi:MAG: hypothetical protein C4B59_05340 [Candidatus Methanogaster sp.]|uniref:Uncharacterized protein n=1 Tax=Candidatus Methanogaster sp. TaxID=3386292 RepID=A0AC61L4E9_9EURY|nr:MAG: hypothetical protein C4B59_05340 [ANME-2 cluster archaeon]
MNKITKASLALVVISIVILLSIFVQSLADEKEEYVTDQVISHIPIRADLGFPDEPILNRTVDITYTLNPLVDVKVNVSEGLILPEGIVFVENNLPIGQITLKKGKKYRYGAKIKTVDIGNWMVYASPGVYANVNVAFGGEVSTVWIQKVWKAKEPITRSRLKENITQEHHDIFMDITKNWLNEHDIQRSEKEEFNCTIISWPASRIHNVNIKCYGCEMLGYSNSKLYDKYYFAIEEDQHTNKTKIRNVYRWAYQTPSRYHQKPVCEEITVKGGENYE